MALKELIVLHAYNETPNGAVRCSQAPPNSLEVVRATEKQFP